MSTQKSQRKASPIGAIKECSKQTKMPRKSCRGCVDVQWCELQTKGVRMWKKRKGERRRVGVGMRMYGSKKHRAFVKLIGVQPHIVEYTHTSTQVDGRDRQISK